MATQKKISKSTLSMFLRTKCDRELYLSLHTETELQNHAMPVPLAARPGIGVLKEAGNDFEEVRNNQIITAFGSSAICNVGANGKPVEAPMKDLLNRVSITPALILQAKIDTAAFKQAFMLNMGMSSTDAALIPRIAGQIPDIVVVRTAEANDEEITKNGSRRSIDAATETRKALAIIDVKHTGEANPSYSAEIALYAISLSNWLEAEGLHNEYFVAVRSYLWTRFKQGQSSFEALLSSGSPHTPQLYLEGLLADCEDANLRFYLPIVLRFFKEDLLRVISIGDASATGWQNLEWHVDGRCSACDWLGHAKWATSDDKNRIAANPSHYCYPCAKQTGHLSQIAGLTRGARKTMQLNAIPTTLVAATAQPAHPAFQEHSHLKKERNKIPARAISLLSNATTLDNTSILASLAPAPQFHAAIAVNFDPSAGLLTGLSVTGLATKYARGQSPRSFQARSFTVDQKTLDDEWIALEGLLSTLSDMIEQSTTFVGATPASLTAQIAFWEKRQFEELCAAMGRHLPRVLALTNRKTKALAWLFPADELLERPDGAISPCIVFIDEIIKRVVFAPTPHVITLFDTAEHYFSGPAPIRVTDSYYREFLTNGIPRERIYEIWSGASVIRRGSVSIPRNTVIQEFANALDKQCRSLFNIVEKLRLDFRGQLKANAPKLALTISSGARGVAFDSKLWIWWEELQYQTNKLESHQRLALDGETLEANYEAIRLTNGRPTGVPSEFIYDVLSGSTEAKLDDNDGFLVLGKEGFPGFPLQRMRDILKPSAQPYTGDDANLTMPLWSSLSVTLRLFDRSSRTATLHIGNWRDANYANYLLANSAIDLMSDVFITKGQSSFKWHDIIGAILREVANPSIATPDVNAATAMGLAPKAPGNDALTPLARVMWDAPALQATQLLSHATALSTANALQTIHGLNDSQRDAVIHSLEKGLTAIWGPPGTGKTQTLAASIHGLVKTAIADGVAIKILVTGPTYKAVEVLIERTISYLEKDGACPAEVYIAYSASKRPKPQPSPAGAHLKVLSFNLDRTNPETQECFASLENNSLITLVATSTMQSYKFAEWGIGNKVGPVFDVVIIDESSQVQVTQALAPLATLKIESRLIVAGDHLQMPPIMALEAPANAEYLVGSIQAYLLHRFVGAMNACPLEINYRSAEDIVGYARLIGYRASLSAFYPNTTLHYVNAIPASQSGFPQGLPWSPLWSELLQVDRKVLTLLHEDDLSSQSNKFEAKIVAALVWCLRNAVSSELDGRNAVTHALADGTSFWEKCIGIVTPHRAQRALVVRELKTLFPHDPAELIEAAVDTVEKFQGGERHTILVTFGVGDADVIAGEEAFLMQLERTNVAISRAMAKCIVIMPTTLAGHVPQDKKALATAHAIKDYVDEFCNLEISGQITDASGASKKAKAKYHG